MTATARTDVAGLRDAVRSLNKIEPGLRKEFTREAAGIMRLIGHIEARLGLAPPNLSPQRLGGIAPAPRG